MSPRPVPIKTRFWAKVAIAGPDECWPWTAFTGANGYGKFALTRSKLGYAHRLAYELAIGPIPEGLQIDHLCRNRACCNPAHLEPVTQQENLRRGLHGVLRTHCVHGHEFTPENTRRRSTGSRMCRQCVRRRRRDYNARRRAVA